MPSPVIIGRILATEKAPKALGPYSQGYVHNRCGELFD